MKHSLTDHELLTVESIAQLAERLPEETLEHNYANLGKVTDPDAVKRSDDPPGEVARNIDTNGCWMVLKNIEQDPAYKRAAGRAPGRGPALPGSQRGRHDRARGLHLPVGARTP